MVDFTGDFTVHLPILPLDGQNAVGLHAGKTSSPKHEQTIHVASILEKRGQTRTSFKHKSSGNKQRITHSLSPTSTKLTLRL